MRECRQTNFSNRTLRAICTAAALVTASLPAMSGDGMFVHRGADGTVTFSDAPMVNGKVVRTSYLNLVRTPKGASSCAGMTHKELSAKGHSLNSEFIRAAQQFSVDPALLKAVARAESCFDPKAESHAGAKGLMQLMPGTAKAMGVSNVFDGKQNLSGGAQYLAAMMARYSSDTRLALAAYNAGPGNVDKYDGVPPFRETRQYIDKVKTFREQYRSQFH